MIPGPGCRRPGRIGGHGVPSCIGPLVRLGRPRASCRPWAGPYRVIPDRGSFGARHGTFGVRSGGVHYSVESAGDGAHARAALPNAKDERVAMTSRILVVDDDTALAEMIGIVLRTEGFDTAFCADGAKAVDVWRAERPDLVLLDLMLPGMDGIEICARVRAESGVPIIMLTARTDTADVVKGLEIGADDYIVKPFNPKELVARIRTRLRPAAQPANDDAAHRRPDGRRRRATRCAAATSAIDLTPLEFELLRRARVEAAAGVLPRDAARAGVGLPLQGRHPAGERARAAPAREGRARPRQPARSSRRCAASATAPAPSCEAPHGVREHGGCGDPARR